MRTTVDIPDELFRQAKAVAALQGRKLKDLVEEGLRRVVGAPEPEGPAGNSRARTLTELMKKWRGIVDSGVEDLASDPKHMEGFGRDSMGNR